MILNNIEPKKVFYFFEEISKIPRGSKNEKSISDYFVKFAKERNLKVIQDKSLNIIIKKSGAKGYENSKGVILQGHMDMVCEKNSDTNHDFLNDPIKLRVIDNMIYADNTTLGADNGIFVAYALAILDSDDICHPPLEILITSEEEVGMGGAIALDPSLIKGEYLINIDSEEEGSLLTSCCGGARSKILIKGERTSLSNDYLPYSISVSGLIGGHSGMDIIKQRGNANKIMGRILLNLLNNNLDFLISNINGGSKINAIPRECTCDIFVKNTDITVLKSILDNTFIEITNEFKSIENNISINLIEATNNTTSFNKKTTKDIIFAISLIPNGIETMSPFINNLPQSSTNLGVVETINNNIIFDNSVRSSVKSLKQDILDKHIIISKALNGEIEIDGNYPEWQFSDESPLRDVFTQTFKDMFNKEPNITAVHAGLECGILKEKLPHLDIISFGPNHYDVHSPNEHVSIDSVKRMYAYLLEVLKRLK